jgi:predicted MFS family arabinose efflux permease
MQASAKSEDEAVGAKKPAEQAATDASADGAGPWAVMLTLDFWLMMSAKCALFVFTQWFMNFVGLFLRTACGFSAAASTNAISVANAGQMVGLLIGGKYYKMLSPRDQAHAVAAGLAVTALVSTALYQRESLPGVTAAILPLLFVWGLCFAVPFYLPPGTYALECGGKRHSTFFTNLFDAGGFTVASVWNRYAATQTRLNAWDDVLWTLVCFSTIALCTMPLAMFRRLPRAKAD